MTIELFRKHMADGLPVENGSEAHLLMHEMSQQALRICLSALKIRCGSALM